MYKFLEDESAVSAGKDVRKKYCRLLPCVSLMCEKHEKSLSDEIKTGNFSKLEKITFLFINTLQYPHLRRDF